MADLEVLTSSDGSASTTIVDRGRDAAGPYLALRHRTTRVMRLSGPHWHPELTERFTVVRGRLGVRVDGVWRSLGPGESAEIGRRRVHEHRCEVGELVLDHVVRPPGSHQEMFEVLAALDRTGRLTRSGLPLDPLAVGMLWRFGDGYLDGVPPRLQQVVLGGLDRLAGRVGHHRRLAAAAGWDPRRWSRLDDPAVLTWGDVVAPLAGTVAAAVVLARTRRRNRSGRRRRVAHTMTGDRSAVTVLRSGP